MNTFEVKQQSILNINYSQKFYGRIFKGVWNFVIIENKLDMPLNAFKRSIGFDVMKKAAEVTMDNVSGFLKVFLLLKHDSRRVQYDFDFFFV